MRAKGETFARRVCGYLRAFLISSQSAPVAVPAAPPTAAPIVGLPPTIAPTAAPPAAPMAPPLKARCCLGLMLAHPPAPSHKRISPRVAGALRFF